MYHNQIGLRAPQRNPDEPDGKQLPSDVVEQHKYVPVPAQQTGDELYASSSFFRTELTDQ